MLENFFRFLNSLSKIPVIFESFRETSFDNSQGREIKGLTLMTLNIV